MAGKLKKLEGLAAVYSEDRSMPNDIAEKIDLSTIEQAELESFSSAGWQFVPEGLRAPQQRRVYKDDSGHVLIEGQYLTLKTNPGVTPDDVEGLADDYGLTIKRTLGLRRNMFQVAPLAATGRPDPVEICAKLEEDERVKWADPSFIEVIGQRRAPDPD